MGIDRLGSQIEQSNDYLRAAKAARITARRLEKYGRMENNVLVYVFQEEDVESKAYKSRIGPEMRYVLSLDSLEFSA